jgi:MarR family transcriptional regulator for hemolysin
MHTDYDFEDSLGYWLTVATQALHRTIGNQLAPQGITFRQAQVIGWLVLTGELSQGELVKRMMIEPPTLVRLLDRMEAAGLIVRVGDPSDRRRRIVQLTEAAGPIWSQIAATLRAVRQTAAQGLTPEEQSQLMQLLRKVQANLDGNRPARPKAAAAVGLKGTR